MHAGVSFIGDLFVTKDSESQASLEIGRYLWEFGQWEHEADFGTLSLERSGQELSLEVDLAELSAEHARAVWR